MDENERLESFSEDVNDILNKMPNWLIRWGITVITTVFLIAVLFSYLIKYPDVIEGDVVVTSKQPPVKLSSNQNKSIKRLYAINKETVKEGEILLEFRSTSSLEEILRLKKLVKDIEQNLSSGELSLYYDISEISISEKQTEISKLNDAIISLRRHIDFDEATKKIELVDKRIQFKKQYGELLNKIYESIEKRTLNDLESFEMQEGLYKQEVISKAQFLTERTSYLTKREQLDEYKKNIVQNKLSIHEDVIEKTNLKNSDRLTRLELESDVLQVINGLKSFYEEWLQTNTIRAPMDGELNYLKNFYVEEYVFAGDPLFAISAEINQFIAYSYIPVAGYGKVKVSQPVRIKLNNFPFQEFGFLEGSVETVSNFSNANTYLTVIKLKNGTQTNIKKKLDITSESTGKVEVVTEEVRLINRLFYNFKKLSNEI